MSAGKIVILGSSYSSAAVVSCLDVLLTKARESVELIWVSDKNHFFYKNHLNQYICDSALLSDIAQPFRNMGVIKPGLSLLERKILKIDFSLKRIKTSEEEIDYQYLVLSCENDTNNGEPDFADDNCFCFNSLQDAVKIKSQIYKNFELALRESSDQVKNQLLTFSVIGAKKNGIELICSIADFTKALLKKQFSELKKSFLKYYLIEKDNLVVPDKDPFYRSRLFYSLNKKGINLLTGSNVTNITKHKFQINQEKEIPSGLIVFAGTKKYSSLIKSLPVKKNSIHLASVDLYLQSDGLGDVFVIGESADCLDLREDLYKNILFYRNQAYTCAYNILAKINNNPLKPFRHNLELDYMFLGSRSSIVEVKGFCFAGFFAWVFHRLIYIISFLRLGKKIRVLLSLLLTVFKLQDDVFVDLYQTKKERQVVKK